MRSMCVPEHWSRRSRDLTSYKGKACGPFAGCVWHILRLHVINCPCGECSPRTGLGLCKDKSGPSTIDGLSIFFFEVRLVVGPYRVLLFLF